MAKSRIEQERHEFAKAAALGIGLPTAVMSFVYLTWKRVETIGDFFSLLTVVQALTLILGNVALCYLGGLILWRWKRKAEDM